MVRAMEKEIMKFDEEPEPDNTTDNNLSDGIDTIAESESIEPVSPTGEDDIVVAEENTEEDPEVGADVDTQTDSEVDSEPVNAENELELSLKLAYQPF